MANKNRDKGNYHERWFVNWLQELGFTAKRQPLSGALGGEYSGDIIWKLGRLELVVEVKYRDKSNFPNPFTVVRDVAFYKRKVGKPKTLVIFDGDVFERDIAPLLAKKPATKRKQELPKDWKPTGKQKGILNHLLGVEIDHDIEATRFRDHHRSKGNTFKRPDLAYKKWCTNAVEWGTATTSGSSAGGGRRSGRGGQESGHFAGLITGLDDF
jgi:Holliday junction resolvase